MEAFYEFYYCNIKSFIANHFLHDAQDLTHDLFVTRLFRSNTILNHRGAPGDLKRFVHTATYHFIFDTFRKRGRSIDLHQAYASYVFSNGHLRLDKEEHLSLEEERSQLLRVLISLLNHRSKLLVYMRMERFTHRKIGEILGTTERASIRKYSTSVEKMRKLVGKFNNSPFRNDRLVFITEIFLNQLPEELRKTIWLLLLGINKECIKRGLKLTNEKLNKQILRARIELKNLFNSDEYSSSFLELIGGLTDLQQEITVSLVQGETIQQIADRLEIGEYTVKFSAFRSVLSIAHQYRGNL